MKPSFALNLTEEGVTLLHRTAHGWLDVGFAAFSDPDLPAALDYLRSTALGLSPKGMTSKLVIPNSQILYTQVEAPGPDEANRRRQIEAALQGRTPYDVADLVYDWQMDGTTARVAVVARETLDEAEGFATEHRFNPLSFVAIPDLADERAFAGEPFFGLSSVAPSLLPDGQTLSRDDTAIAIITREMPKEPVAASHAAAPAAPQTASDPASDPETNPGPKSAPESAEAPTPGPAPAADRAPADAAPPPDAPPPPEATPVPATKTPDPVEPPAPAPVMSAPKSAFPPLSDTHRAGDPAAPPAPAPSAPAPAPSFAPAPSAAQVDSDEAPMAIDVPVEDEAAAPPAQGTAPRPAAPPPAATEGGKDDVPPPLSAAALLAFASRRGAETAKPARSAGVADSGLRDAGPAPAAAPALRAVQGAGSGSGSGTAAPGPRAPAGRPGVERPAAARPAPKFSYDDPVPAPPRLPGDPPVLQPSAIGKAGKGLRNIGAMASAAARPARAGRKPDALPAAGATGPAIDAPSNVATLRPNASAATDGTPPGGVKPDALARGLAARGGAQPGKPRFLGLILTGILLLILALVAAWSSYYLTQRDQGAPVAVAASDAPAAAAEPVSAAAPAPAAEPVSALSDEIAADAQTASDEDITAPAALAPDTTPLPDAAEPAPDLADPAPQTGLDSDAAAAAPPASTTGDEIFLAGMDAPPALNDPVVLADPTSASDALPSPQMPPPPFGTVYTFDENGLIQPTPEGILSPEGVMLVAGKPPRVPPARPASVETAAPPVADTAATPAATPADATGPASDPAGTQATAQGTPAATDAAILPEQTYAADPSLANARPRLRPPEFVPPAAQTPDAAPDDASLAPAEGSRFASLRPRARPAVVLAAGESARAASQAASLAANSASEAAILQASAPVSPGAVLVSRVPAPRPRNLSRAVEAAVAAATRQQPAARAAPEPEPKGPEPKGKVHDEADDEPEVATAAPRIPTRANVAKQATFVNAINLSKINLIGVYGSQSRRYALIRQANGRYKKVSVGDSIDGGKVQAITASEVRYQKGGRLISLGMPKG